MSTNEPPGPTGEGGSFALGIVAHESRITQAKELFDEVRADVMYIDGGTQPLGCGKNHERVWQSLTDHHADWLVTLEDDAVPCPNFRDQLAQALAVSPAPFVSLYLGKGFPRHWQQRFGEIIEAASEHTCWAITSGWMLHAVGIAVRADLVPGMLKHLERAIGVPVDQAIGQHARNTGHKVSYTLPSLVDHADGETIHAHQDGQPREPGRKAWRMGTRPQWNSKTIEMG
jgi:GR25 family glycosyltransferase involved in LPS biosynthesis